LLRLAEVALVVAAEYATGARGRRRPPLSAPRGADPRESRMGGTGGAAGGGDRRR